MKVFISDKLDKQIKSEFVNRTDIVERLDTIVKKFEYWKNQNDCNSDKGFKKFKEPFRITV